MRYEPLQPMGLRLALGLTLAVLCLAHPSRTLAQGMSCSTAQTTLLKKNSTRSELEMAMARMVNCGDLAPGGIVKMLRQVNPRSIADTVARQGAWALLDNRLMDSVRVLAVSANQATERRLFFLRLLTRYAALNAGVNDKAANLADAPSVLFAVHHPGGVVGTNPLTTDGRNRARATIRTMGLQDTDATLRKLAGLVYEELRYYMQ